MDQVDKDPAVDEIRNTSLVDLFSSRSTNSEGLSSREAKNRLEKYGYNEIEEKKINPLRGIFGYFWPDSIHDRSSLPLSLLLFPTGKIFG